MKNTINPLHRVAVRYDANVLRYTSLDNAIKILTDLKARMESEGCEDCSLDIEFTQDYVDGTSLDIAVTAYRPENEVERKQREQKSEQQKKRDLAELKRLTELYGKGQ